MNSPSSPHLGCKSELVVWVLTAGYLPDIPVWQEGELGVSVDGVGHISVGLVGEEVDHAGGGTIILN